MDEAGVRAWREPLLLLLQDSVDSGASVGFLPPLSREAGLAFWDEVAASVGRGERLVWGVRAGDGGVDGTVQLVLAEKENARHRAEVSKLLVHTRVRRRGLGRALMRAVEDEARRLGRTTLVLDTLAGSEAEPLYRSLGWTVIGTIDRYARVGDGSLQPTVVYARWL